MILINKKIISSRVKFIKKVFFKFHVQKFSFRCRNFNDNYFSKILTFFLNFQMINLATRRRRNSALTSKTKFYLIVLLMSLNFYIKTFVFAV